MQKAVDNLIDFILAFSQKNLFVVIRNIVLICLFLVLFLISLIFEGTFISILLQLCSICLIRNLLLNKTKESIKITYLFIGLAGICSFYKDIAIERLSLKTFLFIVIILLISLFVHKEGRSKTKNIISSSFIRFSKLYTPGLLWLIL